MQMFLSKFSLDSTKLLFISVDINTYKENINFNFPTKYYEESLNIMVRIRPHLYKEYGDSIPL